MHIDSSQQFSSQDLKKPIHHYIIPSEITFSYHQTVQEALQQIQTKTVKRQVEYFYLTDEKNLLQGMITIKELLYSPPQTPLIDLIETDIIKLEKEAPLEKGLKLMTEHQLLAIPVVDKGNRFIGVLEILPHPPETWYTSKKIQQKHLKEDLFQFIGFSIEQAKTHSSWLEFRYRMPWLTCNLIGGLICAAIGEFFQMTLKEFVILALFIPLVLTLSESVAIQSMTLSLRFLHLKKIFWNQVYRRLVVEWKASFLLACASGLGLCLFYFALSIDLKPIFSILSSMIIAMTFCASFGTIFPIFLHWLKLDPKVAAGPVVLMMADVFTIAIYLTLSSIFLFWGST